MTISQMYRGQFKLKHSPWVDKQVCDYPNDERAKQFLKNRLDFLTDEESEASMPTAMIQGLAYKIRFIEETQKKERAPMLKVWQSMRRVG
jgi:hypothetical protein